VAGKHDQIAGSLIDDILSGHYRVNERLPSERDLSARFDASRGAVREAMKKLETIGLAEVQPGGARVKDKSEASLDVIGHLLAQSAMPDPRLIDQILVALGSMMGIAAEQTLELASDEELEQIRALAQPLFKESLEPQAHLLARMELMQRIMQSSQNLPLQLISRSLFDQFVPNMAALHAHRVVDHEVYSTFARQLDQALAKKDVDALRATFTAFSNLNRQTMMQALDAARGAYTQTTAPAVP